MSGCLGHDLQGWVRCPTTGEERQCTGWRGHGRVSRGPVVVLTVDAPVLKQFWLADYFPEVIALDQARFPTLEQVTGALAQGSAEVRVDVSPVPVDCTDGFGEAFYAPPRGFPSSGSPRRYVGVSS